MPQASRISDREAERLLARLLVEAGENLAQAVGLYQRLVALQPDELALRLEYGHCLLRLHRIEAARRELAAARELLARQHPGAPAVLADLADLEAEFGHLAQCRDLYEQALALSGGSPELGLRFAERMNQWGDFYRAEGVYRAQLAKEPGNAELRLALAETLANSQRFAEAEGLYRELLLLAPERTELFLALARLKYAQGDDGAARPWIKEFLAKKPHELEGWLLLGELLLRQGEGEAALSHFQEMARRFPESAQASLGQGRACLRLGQSAAAEAAFAAAVARAPEMIEARFFAAGKERVSQTFLARLLAEDGHDPMALVRWGTIYAEHGEQQAAIACLRTAIAGDPACFPARLGLAEVLASDQQYEDALEELAVLEKEFPDNPKLLLTQARVLSWARQYDAALALYDRLALLNPDSPVALIERARTAAWAKRLAESQGFYAELWARPVDAELLERLQRLQEAGLPTPLLDEHSGTGTPGEGIFSLYESFDQAVEADKNSLSPADWQRLALLRAELFGRYCIQKGAFLESRGKELAWEQRPLAAKETYAALLAFQAGNQEARLDAAQVDCRLGLGDEEAEAYRQLLAISPLHTMAASALARQQIRSSPGFAGEYSYWKEEGRGELSRMERQRQDLVAELPLASRFLLQASLGEEQERTGLGYGPYRSQRLGLSLAGPITAALRGSVGWSDKEYAKEGLADLGAGHAALWYNLNDLLEVGAGLKRTDEIYNQFGLLQGVQADHWWGAVNSNLSRRLRLETMAEHLAYTDDNSGEQQTVALGYLLSDHPHLLRLIVDGSHRDTREQNLYRTVAGQTRDIIHPYWTPEDYWSYGLTLEWQHDLARLFFCGGEQHYYDIRLGVGSDSEENPSAHFEVSWHYDFAEHWQAELKGLIHRSEEWDATGLWATLRYRF